ncbi:hypothetical protein V2J09_008640 [Rumex salicifolius]
MYVYYYWGTELDRGVHSCVCRSTGTGPGMSWPPTICPPHSSWSTLTQLRAFTTWATPWSVINCIALHCIAYMGVFIIFGKWQGTLMMLGGLSEGRLVKRVRSVALLSPVAYLSHMTTALGILAAHVFVGEMISQAGVAEFNPKGAQAARLVKQLCRSPGVDCYDILSALTDPNSDVYLYGFIELGHNCCLNSSTVTLFLQNEPQSTSVKNMVHLAQTVRDGVLAKYNYARPDYNLQHYGEVTPPIYNLSRIPRDIPLFLSYGGNDALSDTRDVLNLLDLLKLHDVDKLSVQFIKDYAHADFIMGVNANNLVYNRIIRFFQLH